MAHGEMLEDDKQGDRKARAKTKPSLQLVRGTPFATHLLRECFESAMDYSHREGDLFIVTYLKCGTTWMQHIVYLIQTGGERVLRTPPICGSRCTRWAARPGAMKSHLPLHQTGYSPEARYIVVIRNPFDVVVSLHHFWRMISSYEYYGDFDDSFENFVDGSINSGDYFDFYRGWCRRIDDSNVLFLVYEDMRKDPEAAVLKDVLKYSSFEEMKEYTNKMIDEFYEGVFPFQGEEYKGLRYLHRIIRRGSGLGGAGDSGSSPDKVVYVREGTVGGWKNYFSPEQTRRLGEKFRWETRDTPIANLWPELNIGNRESTHKM
ncbi:hypothetical protein HPB50_006170 [Hyalomma asiaticum]|uniref:Uncharacterized protein n=1 Tax=Hyalomma asiaticum TaxID=266040 RepID=A0ACB7TCN5_HYAAI|nr:hypothetical protein HPB50_006170 [Hyalomma asiaticum]